MHDYAAWTLYGGGHGSPGVLVDANTLFRADVRWSTYASLPTFIIDGIDGGACGLSCTRKRERPFCVNTDDSVSATVSRSCVNADTSNAMASQRLSIGRGYSYNDEYVRCFGMTKKLYGHDGCVNCMSMDESGEWLVTGSDDLHVCLYHLPDYDLRHRFRTRHRGNIFAAQFVPGYRERVLSCGLDGRALLLDVVSGRSFYKSVLTPMASCLLCGVYASPHCALVGYFNGCIARLDTRCRAVSEPSWGNPFPACVRAVYALASPPGHPYTVACATDGGLVFWTDERVGSLHAYAALTVPALPWPSASSTRRGGREDGMGLSGLCFSERGDLLALNYRNEDVYVVRWRESMDDGEAEAEEEEEEEEAVVVAEEGDESGRVCRCRVPCAAAASANRAGRHGAPSGPPSRSRSRRRAGVFWLGDGARQIPMHVAAHARALRGRTNVMTLFKNVIFMENDRIVCTGGDDGMVYCWSLRRRRLLHRTRGDSDVVNGVLYHPRVCQLLSCGMDPTVKVLGAWEAKLDHWCTNAAESPRRGSTRWQRDRSRRRDDTNHLCRTSHNCDAQDLDEHGIHGEHSHEHHTPYDVHHDQDNPCVNRHSRDHDLIEEWNRNHHHHHHHNDSPANHDDVSEYAYTIPITDSVMRLPEDPSSVRPDDEPAAHSTPPARAAESLCLPGGRGSTLHDFVTRGAAVLTSPSRRVRLVVESPRAEDGRTGSSSAATWSTLHTSATLSAASSAPSSSSSSSASSAERRMWAAPRADERGGANDTIRRLRPAEDRAEDASTDWEEEAEEQTRELHPVDRVSQSHRTREQAAHAADARRLCASLDMTADAFVQRRVCRTRCSLQSRWVAMLTAAMSTRAVAVARERLLRSRASYRGFHMYLVRPSSSRESTAEDASSASTSSIDADIRPADSDEEEEEEEEEEERERESAEEVFDEEEEWQTVSSSGSREAASATGLAEMCADAEGLHIHAAQSLSDRRPCFLDGSEEEEEEEEEHRVRGAGIESPSPPPPPTAANEGGGGSSGDAHAPVHTVAMNVVDAHEVPHTAASSSSGSSTGTTSTGTREDWTWWFDGWNASGPTRRLLPAAPPCIDDAVWRRECLPALRHLRRCIRAVERGWVRHTGGACRHDGAADAARRVQRCVWHACDYGGAVRSATRRRDGEHGDYLQLVGRDLLDATRWRALRRYWRNRRVEEEEEEEDDDSTDRAADLSPGRASSAPPPPPPPPPPPHVPAPVGLLPHSGRTAARREREPCVVPVSARQRHGVRLLYHLHMMDVLLQGAERVCTEAPERRAYWHHRAWLELRLVYYHAAVGNLTAALTHCARLDGWVEFASLPELGGGGGGGAVRDEKRCRAGRTPAYHHHHHHHHHSYQHDEKEEEAEDGAMGPAAALVDKETKTAVALPSWTRTRRRYAAPVLVPLALQIRLLQRAMALEGVHRVSAQLSDVVDDAAFVPLAPCDERGDGAESGTAWEAHPTNPRGRLCGGGPSVAEQQRQRWCVELCRRMRHHPNRDMCAVVRRSLSAVGVFLMDE